MITMTPSARWSAPPQTLILGNDQVHVWRAPLDLPTSRVQHLRRTLATAEMRRADRYHFEKDRQHLIVARGLLRAILSRYVGIEPDQLCFCYGPQGKPQLAGETDKKALCFNVSHSHELVLYTFARGREIGIDLEYMRPDTADVEIAERFFSPREIAALRALPADAQREAFFACWTRKEAYLKARGDGLALDLDQFDVSLVPGEPAALLSTDGDPQEASHWSLQELNPGPGYAAALAVEGQDWQLKCWQWKD